MSYLNVLRLHFAGQFQANVSTVNNDPAHFNNAAFMLPNYQELQGPNMQPPNGWFNPQGDAAFRLFGCKVTSAWTSGGQVPSSDTVTSCLVADSDNLVPAKLADLDSEQQLVSEIWGLQVRITDSQGNSLMVGDFEPMAFMDLWDRALNAPPGSDVNGGAMWQSVLRDLEWRDVASSPFLTALKQAANATGMLSIKFNVDGINMDFTSPDFMCGRIVGTIGPAASDEPHHLVIGRQLMALPGPNPNFFNPLGHINFCVGRIDSAAKCALFDLGNALPTKTPGSGLADLGALTVNATTDSSGTTVGLGTILNTGPNGYTAAGWYENTAGIIVLPLTDGQMQAAAANRLTITGDGANAENNISEWPSGAFVRADTYVYRMSPGDTVPVTVYAMQWGQPLASAKIGFTLDPSQLQPTPDQPPYVGVGPSVAVPADVLRHGVAPINTTPPTVTTDAAGRGVLTVTAGDPGNVRWFTNGQGQLEYGIDGQVYGLRPAFTDEALNTGPTDQWNFVSFLVWSGFQAPKPVTWNDLAPIFLQYSNLYPVMNRFLDLSNYESVVAHSRMLSLAFGLNPHDPNSMPATRDLSPAKRAAILAWLADPAHPEGQPAGVAAAVAPPPGATVRVLAAVTMKGGKTAAAARRLVLQTV